MSGFFHSIPNAGQIYKHFGRKRRIAALKIYAPTWESCQQKTPIPWTSNRKSNRIDVPFGTPNWIRTSGLPLRSSFNTLFISNSKTWEALGFTVIRKYSQQFINNAGKQDANKSRAHITFISGRFSVFPLYTCYSCLDFIAVI